jgi:septum formation protein
VLITPSRPLVLGSASPRRRELVALLGVPFVVRPALADESMGAESPPAYLERITRAKLEAVRATGLGEIAAVLVADTIVVSPTGAVLGKPRDDEDSMAMIELLAAATHEVSTRFVLAEADPRSPVAHAETVTTRVTFRAVTREEARAYAATGEGRDKAGAYAAQGRAAAFIRRIEGSYTSVVGLPLCEVAMAMRALGLV